MYSFIFYLILLIALIFIINYFAKKEFVNKQFARKLTHIVTGIVVSTFPFLLTPIYIWILSIVFVVMMAISKLKKILVLNNVERVTWGEVYFPASVGICAFISLPQNTNAYFVGILSLTFADTAANIVGRLFPIKIINIGSQTKSIGGMLACILMVFLIISLFYGFTNNSLIYIVAISIIIGFVELISIYGLDNITVPIVATLLSLTLNV